jgi:hypothetical protein
MPPSMLTDGQMQPEAAYQQEVSVAIKYERSRSYQLLRPAAESSRMLAHVCTVNNHDVGPASESPTGAVAISLQSDRGRGSKSVPASRSVHGLDAR